MTQPAEEQKGELWVAIGALFLLLGSGLPFVAADVGNRMQQLATKGVVAQAEVLSSKEEEWREENYRGISKLPRKRQTLTIRFDRMATTSHRDYLAAQRIESPAYPPSPTIDLPTTIELIVGPDEYAKYGKDTKVAVTFLPDAASFDKDSLQLTEVVASQSSPHFIFGLYGGAAAMFLFGLWAAIRGWKQGKSK